MWGVHEGGVQAAAQRRAIFSSSATNWRSAGGVLVLAEQALQGIHGLVQLAGVGQCQRLVVGQPGLRRIAAARRGAAAQGLRHALVEYGHILHQLRGGGHGFVGEQQDREVALSTTRACTCTWPASTK